MSNHWGFSTYHLFDLINQVVSMVGACEIIRQLYKKNNMTLISLVITLIVIGVILWLVNTYIPMDGKIKQILNIVVVIAVVLWLLQAFGLLSGLGNIRIG